MTSFCADKIGQTSIESEILRVVRSYFYEDDRTESVLCSVRGRVHFDGEQRWTKRSVSTATVHDEDYTVLKRFGNSHGIVLDIGANCGYSVTTLRAVGCGCKIISFEANGEYHEALESLSTLFPDSVGISLVALGESDGCKCQVTPVINGICIGALSTLSRSPHIPSLARNIFRYYSDNFAGEGFRSFRLFERNIHVRALDSLIKERVLPFGSETVVAMKIDVEGFESEVVSGAANLLRSHKPLILAESGHQNTSFLQIMQQYDYVSAVRDNDKLIWSDHKQDSLNAFFIHPSQEDWYRELGIL